MKLRTCVSPEGKFTYGIHKPDYQVTNLRELETIGSLGSIEGGSEVTNERNFPLGDVDVPGADWVYEIPNVFPFRGTTFINQRWADRTAEDPSQIHLPPPSEVSFTEVISKFLKPSPSGDAHQVNSIFTLLPDAVLLALAANSTDPEDLVQIAHLCCEVRLDPKTQEPVGLTYEHDRQGNPVSIIKNHAVFETLVNNPHLPERYKQVMVLKPGAQGGSEIVGEWNRPGHGSHVFEYLRRNSYIAGGHYAANMADDAVRYRINALSSDDFTGLRHLYYQRTYVRLAEQLGLPIPAKRKTLSVENLESLRLTLMDAINKGDSTNLVYDGTIWGWNFGFDFAPSHYRLHASHQQIHQQYAMAPKSMEVYTSDGHRSQDELPTYACGDLITEFAEAYFKETRRHFFDDYLTAVRTNQRTDLKEGECSLIIFEDDHVMAFVPKAQVSQWEVQLMTRQAVGNILEADADCRHAIDRGIIKVQRILEAMGAKMVTTIEFAKRFRRSGIKQHLIYDFLPKLPESPGAFSEAQYRWITGMYPEDFAVACRKALKNID